MVKHSARTIHEINIKLEKFWFKFLFDSQLEIFVPFSNVCFSFEFWCRVSVCGMNVKGKKVFRLFRKSIEFEWSPWAHNAYFIHITFSLQWLSFHRVVNAVVVDWISKNMFVCLFVCLLSIVIGNSLFQTFQPWCSTITHIPFLTFLFNRTRYVSIFQYFLLYSAYLILKMLEKKIPKQYHVVLITSSLQWFLPVFVYECFSSLLQTPRYDKVLCFSI